MNRTQVDKLIALRLVHEIHTSERRSFRGCRRRWDWLFRQMYYPKTTAKPLEFGIAYHVAMEVYYNPDTWTWPNEYKVNKAISTFVKTCEGQRQKYLDVNDEQYITNAEVEEDYDERVVLGKGMLKYHLGEIAPKIDTTFKPLKVEVEFIVPIQNPDTNEYLFCKCDKCRKKQENSYEHLSIEQHVDGPYEFNPATGQCIPWEGLPVCLAGRVDLLAEDQYGDLWIIDWKTAASIRQDQDEHLYLDDQISSYVMAFRRKMGLKVRGFIYHEQRKAFPEAPHENKQRRLGCLFSVNKNQAVDHKTYLETVQEFDKEAYEAGLYDEFLKFLQDEGTVFWKRYQIHRSDVELYNIEKMLFLEASEMTDPNLRIYPSPGRFSCGFCAFRQPCLGQTGGEDYMYTLDSLYEKKTRAYWEEKNALSTETTGGE